MIDEKDVKFGDMFLPADYGMDEAPIMFIAWDEPTPTYGNLGKSWVGLYFFKVPTISGSRVGFKGGYWVRVDDR